MDAPHDGERGKSSLDDIEFLARSAHRVRVLDALAHQPSDRDDLRAGTGASSPTMGRILADLEKRRWIIRNGRNYELTPLGEYFSEANNAMDLEYRLVTATVR